MSYDLLCIGEILWDELPDGRRLGGAPLNVCVHANQAGLQAACVSAVGVDDDGRAIRQQLDELGVAQTLITDDPAHATGRVSVSLNEQGVPSYTIIEQVAWDHIPLSDHVLDVARRARACCFGSLAQRSEQSRACIQAVIGAVPEDAYRIFDVNLRAPFYSAEVFERGLQLANVAKISDEELPELCRHLGLPSGDIELVVQQLFARYQLQLIALTMGRDGSLLCRPDQPVHHQPIIDAPVADTVGAGDSFTAILITGLLRGWSDARINEVANRVTAFVVSQTGATPSWPAELQSLMAE